MFLTITVLLFCFFLILMDPFLLPWLPPVDIIFPFLFLSHDISHSMLLLSIHKMSNYPHKLSVANRKMQKI